MPEAPDADRLTPRKECVSSLVGKHVAAISRGKVSSRRRLRAGRSRFCGACRIKDHLPHGVDVVAASIAPGVRPLLLRVSRGTAGGGDPRHSHPEGRAALESFVARVERRNPNARGSSLERLETPRRPAIP